MCIYIYIYMCVCVCVWCVCVCVCVRVCVCVCVLGILVKYRRWTGSFASMPLLVFWLLSASALEPSALCSACVV